ncbi:MAG: hypothetical protein QF464_19165, partial [Myxococcota bacterium]|nr:hypothetical protein [Myxococcota bacterium]
EGLTVRGSDRKLSARILCSEGTMTLGEAQLPSSVVELAPAAGLVGVHVACGVLCEQKLADRPTIHLLSSAPDTEPQPTIVSFVTVTSGDAVGYSSSSALRVDAFEGGLTALISHVLFFNGHDAIEVIIRPQMTGALSVTVTDTIFHSVLWPYWVHDGAHGDPQGVPNYTLTAASNYVCGEADAAITDYLQEGVFSASLVTPIASALNCDACTPSGPADHDADNLAIGGCPLTGAGTEYGHLPLDEDGELNYLGASSDIGPFQGVDGCAFNAGD